MFKTTLKGLLAHKVRLVTTMASIVLGVALMAGTLVLTDTIGRTFDDLYADIGRGTDAVVRSASKVPGSQGAPEQRGTVPASLLDTVRAVDGVHAADGNVQGYAQFVGKNGKAIGNPGMGAPTLGFNWPGPGMPNPFNFVAGHEPRGADEVVMDKASADKGSFVVGDRVKVLNKGEPREMTVAGIVRFGTVDSPLGASIAIFDTPTAEDMLGARDEFQSITVVARPGLSQELITASLSRALPAGTEAVTGDTVTKEQQNQTRAGLAFFSYFLLTFAIIALFVGSFIIYNTFSIIVAQRTRELALLRALGADRRQVQRAVLIEALIIGTISSVIGVGAGVLMTFALKALLAVFGFDIPASGIVVTGGTILVTVLTGIVITVVSAYFPARKASRVPPIAAMRDIAIDTGARSPRRIAAGVVLTLVGIALLTLGLIGDSGNPLVNVGVGAAIIFLGVTVLGPVIARPVSQLLGAPVAASRGIAGHLAQVNATRNPKRTSSTASALMIGVALVGFITIFAASAKASIDKTIDESFTGDFAIDSSTQGFGGLSPELATALTRQPEIERVTSLRLMQGVISGSEQFLVAVDPTTVGDFVDLSVKQGSLEGLDANGLAVSEKIATDRGWKLGDTVPASFTTGDRPLEIAAIYTKADIVRGYVVGFPLANEVLRQPLDFQVYAKLKPGVPAAAGRAAVERVASAYPNATVQDLTEFKAAQARPIDQLLALIYALLFLAVLIALMGIANTLALSIHERTRELGLLRAVGMTRAQLRSTVRWESVIIALFGTVLGLAVGLFFGWAIIRALASQGFSELRLPIGQLLVVTVLAGLAGVVAALLPARRAARLNVLDAITTE